MTQYQEKLQETAQRLVAKGRGILAADESTGTIGKRFSSINVENNEPNRRAYRDLLFRTKQLNKFISGVILFDETLRQKAVGGRQFLRDLLQKVHIDAGIKVDTGAKPLAGYDGETITEGLDGLRERLADYAALGATFTKWRAVIKIDGNDLPSNYAITANMQALARYAALAQEAGLVPIVEPEVLMDGRHDIEACYHVTAQALGSLYYELAAAGVLLEGTLLKPNMVLPGKSCAQQVSNDVIARMTIDCLKRHVPSAVPGIVFLSGGQDNVDATGRLDAMNKLGNLPWKLSYSYGRALQDAALKTWCGQENNIASAQEALLHRARMNSLAAQGKWNMSIEQQSDQ